MKLYTEEQVKEMLNRARLHNQDDTEMFSNDYLIATVTPIELPSDEVTNKTIRNYNINDFGQAAAFIAGAKWMKEQILNQNK